VYDRYGCREVGNIAHECSHGGLHVNAESFHLEEEANPSIAGGKNLVVTCFDNLAMPFLRYRIGDLARLEDGRCGCGRTLPLMSSVTGRTTDFFSLASGAELSFLFFNHFFEQYGGIVDLYQVEQTAADRLSIRIVAGSRFEPGEEGRIRERLLSEWGDRVAIDVERVDGIEREKSGKLRVYRPLRA
jgi:phenylacetate-CoA ligase